MKPFTKRDERYSYKLIANQNGTKIRGEVARKLVLCFVDHDNYIINASWNYFSKSKLPWGSSQEAEDSPIKAKFIKNLLKQEKQLKKQVEYNRWLNDNKTASFEDKVNMVFKMTKATYLKTGLKDTL